MVGREQREQIMVPDGSIPRVGKALWRNVRRLPGILRRRPTLEVHVPIAPRPSFLNQLRCLTHSLRRFGGAYRDAPVIATVGGEEIDEGLSDRMPWLAANGIELRWVPAADFAARGVFATGATRLLHEFRSEMVLLLDADTLIRRPLDELIDQSYRDRVVAGVIAHLAPLIPWNMEPPSWANLFAICGLPEPRLEYEHTCWGYMFSDPRHRHCPAYFNYGVIAAPAEAIARIGPVAERHLPRIREAVGTGYDAQLAFTMAIAELGLPARALPMRYNMANQPLIEAIHHEEVDRAVILHLLFEQQIRRPETFDSLASLETFLARTDLRVTNLMAQEVIRSIFPALVEEERNRPEAA
ncbi:MAG: hypothetical protein ACLQGP_00090 [Isosphaeraceae bacterium]